MHHNYDPSLSSWHQPENILVGTDGYIRLTDMGFAKIVPIKTYTMCGTPDYIAPEIILNRVRRT